MVVDFPAPFGPEEPVHLPRGDGRSRPSRARVAPNVLTRSWMAITGSVTLPTIGREAPDTTSDVSHRSDFPEPLDFRSAARGGPLPRLGATPPAGVDPLPKHASRLVVYTAVLGDEQPLREQPVADVSTSDFVCFTDDPRLGSDTWETVLVQPRVAADPVRSARFLKIVGHPALAGYDRSLWVDNAVELRKPPELFVGDWLADAHVAAPQHTLYATVAAEAEAAIDLGKDDHLRVFEQLAHYLDTTPGALEARQHWTGLLARRGSQTATMAMTLWWEHVLRYSSRDQLSFGVAMTAAGVWVRSVPLANLQSAVHAWPGGPETRADADAHARTARVRAEIEEVLSDVHDRDEWILELESRLTAATDKVRQLRTHLSDGA